MLATDQDALICDMAETYGVLDIRSLPVPLLATLAVGLRENSRIQMKLRRAPVSYDTLLSASAVDSLNLLVWSKTENARKGRGRPQSVVSALLGKNDGRKHDDVQTFRSPAEFRRAWGEVTGGEAHGN